MKIGADGLIAISSGSHPDLLRKGWMAPPDRLIIRRAVEREIYDPTLRPKITEATVLHNAEGTSSLYDIAYVRLSDEEKDHRASMEKELDIEGKLKTIPEQTVARPETIAAVSLSPRNGEKAKDIYHAVWLDPASTPSTSRTPSGGYADYQKAIFSMKERVLRLVDRIIFGYRKNL
ncbi:hypothetical protein JXB02_04655 [Candidatus Woesearchaeota archaeon]|nr:hypothetical protein [Candidatus Woesearchaeota archaeon]